MSHDDENISEHIKHIVISGGGHQGLIFYGMLRETHKAGLWNLKNIKTMYGTSVGAFMAVVLCLDFEWSVLDDFFIKRPWHTVLKIDFPSYFRAFEKKGMIDKTIYEDVMKPLFAAKDIPINITMNEFYEHTGIELHIFTTEMNQMKTVDISYKTHPNWSIIKALHSSSTLPIIFEPYIEITDDLESNKTDTYIYIDGGILMNYPIKPCITNGANPDEILAIYKKNDLYNKDINSESSFFDYIISLLNRVFDKTLRFSEGECPNIKNEYYVVESCVSIEDLVLTSKSIEERQRLIQVGSDRINKNDL